MSNGINETNAPITEAAPATDAASNTSDKTQFIHELKEKYSLILSKFVGQITLEFVDRHGDTGNGSNRDSLKTAFAEAHDMVAEMVAESKEFAMNMDFGDAKLS